MEFLSVSSVARDYGVKARLYAALGVTEYWVWTWGGMRGPDSPSPVELPMFRPRSLRSAPGTYEPRFQWWDAAQGRWRDPESDAAYERQAERDRHVRELQVMRTEERVEMTIASLHTLPSDHLHSRYQDRIAAHWRKTGPPSDVMNRLLQVRQAPAEWRSLLRIPDGNLVMPWFCPQA